MKSITTVMEKTNAELLNKLSETYQFYEEQGDQVRIEKVKDLIKKAVKNERMVAFCGHFSAGKSTMVNMLAGQDVLPTSPIPTSANLVKIKIGTEHFAKVYFQDGKVHKYPAPFDLQKLKNLAKDGEIIHSIEIELPKGLLPTDSIILDTPGIDSTDQAHKLATESAMHLADSIFYCMDYNHVQAEENFLFTKEVASFGKDVYLIVNMIDKHQESELSMEQFKQSVKDSFAAWSIEPKRIFYTSLKDMEHPHNEYLELVSELERIFKANKELKMDSSLKLLMEEHLQKVIDDSEEKREQLETIISSQSHEEHSQILERYENLKLQYERKTNAPALFEKQYNQELDLILNNAYLMPAETREQARVFLESIQKDFKVGVLFTKKKTEEKRAEILQAFIEMLKSTVESQITWHVKTLFTNLLKEYDIYSQNLESQIGQLEITFDEKLIMASVRQGALVTGDSVLVYTNELAQSIKNEARSQLKGIVLEIKKQLTGNNSSEATELAQQIAELKEYKTANEELAFLENKYEHIQVQLKDIIENTNSTINEKTLEYLQSLIVDHHEEVIKLEADQDTSKKPESKKAKIIPFRKEDKENVANDTEQQAAMVEKLTQTSHIIKSIPSMEKLADELIERAERLKNQQFTVALFGAFSAGKSSFANALIGEKLLPVSPNPTTATINRILPADATHSNATGTVKLKSEQMLLEDLNEALQHFGKTAQDLEDAYKLIGSINDATINREKYHTHLSFLHAFTRGYDSFKGRLGQEVEVTKEEFQAFVAQEDKSCFVSSIDFYVDSKVTNQGITFVDTPGADSINARHTDVAFEYIKNADAIIFVTYYNHAFSKADREFLIQLGRVKDQFSLDKMFFVVNAIDLANTEEELGDVLDYVEGQLLTFGIRNPHLYPVSSLNALKEKLTNVDLQSRFQNFEQGFYQFITGDLRQIAISASQKEWENAYDRVKYLVETASQDISQKEKRRFQLEQERENIQEIIDNSTSSALKDQIDQELNELIYYINQRAGFRYQDFFTESFSPATIKGSPSEAKKALREAAQELVTSIGFDLSQELRATSLRMENFLNKLLNDTHNMLISQILKVDGNLKYHEFEPKKLSTPSFENELKNLTPEYFVKELNMFKNAKAFFEKNEKKLMAEAVQNRLNQPLNEYLHKGKDFLEKLFTESLKEGFSDIISHLNQETAEQFDGWFSVLDNKIDLDELKLQMQQLKVLDKQ